MNPIWYLNRLKKMSTAEIFKRIVETICHYASRIKYTDPEKWPYERFADQLASGLSRFTLYNRGDRLLNITGYITTHLI